jgi:steroid 5-alpha reductase family enzyme
MKEVDSPDILLKILNKFMPHYFYMPLNSQVENLFRLFLTIMLIVAVVCFIVSEITRNYSQVDKLWSLMPIIYSILAFLYYPSTRLLIMSCLVILWGLRLSYNFYRKGGYSIIPWKGEEDYRWKIMRQNPNLKGRLRFGMFNLFFISLYQHFLILLFCTPLIMAAKYHTTHLTALDIVASVLMLVFIIFESVSDNQQFRFQTLKRNPEYNSTLYAKSIERGFLSEGLWHFVRHPNFIAEQLIWISFYLFAVAASGKILNWTISGAVMLILLFQGSSLLTEKISSEKYPGYAAYKEVTPRFFPQIFKSRR